MILRCPLLAVTVLATLVSSADAQKSATPLLDAVRTFCIATGAHPYAVRDAVLKAGGKALHPFAATMQPFPMTVTSWEFIANGHDLTISAGTATIPPSATSPQRINDNCIITSRVNEDASIAALQKWIGVAPDTISPGELAMSFYSYVEESAAHAPVPAEGAAYRAAVAQGRIWSVTLQRSANYASVQMFNVQPVSPAKNSRSGRGAG